MLDASILLTGYVYDVKIYTENFGVVKRVYSLDGNGDKVENMYRFTA